jgi:hypothetical protein
MTNNGMNKSRIRAGRTENQKKRGKHVGAMTAPSIATDAEYTSNSTYFVNTYKVKFPAKYRGKDSN